MMRASTRHLGTILGRESLSPTVRPHSDQFSFGSISDSISGLTEDLEACSDSSGWLKTPVLDWGSHPTPAESPGWFQLPRKVEFTTATLMAIASGMALGALCYKYFTMSSTPQTLRHQHVTVGEFMQAELQEQQLFLRRVFPPSPLPLQHPAFAPNTCQLCLEHPSTVLTTPCNHTVMCQDCDLIFLVNILKTIFQRRATPPSTLLSEIYLSNLLPTQDYLCIVCRSQIARRFSTVPR